MPIYDDLDDQGSFGDWLARCRRDYEGTGDPLFVWEAFGAWWSQRHMHSMPLPEWLGECLNTWGSRLIGIPMEVVRRTPLVRVNQDGIKFEINEIEERPHVPAEPGEGPGPIGRALGFTEGLAKAREHWGGPFDRREQHALQVVDFMWEHGYSLDKAATELAPSAGPDNSRTIRRYVEHARSAALRRMQDLIREAGQPVPPAADVPVAFSRLCRRRSLTKHAS